MRRIAALTILLVAAYGSWYLSQSLSTPTVQPQATTVHREGFYLRAAKILGTDELGHLLYRIEADYAQQTGTKEIDFQNVRIHYASVADVPWTLVADRASIGEDQQLVSLSGNVIAVSNEGFSGDVTEIRTQYLEFEPESFVAETEDRVQVRIGARSLTATGMLALLQENRVQLKSNVSGKFLP